MTDQYFVTLLGEDSQPIDGQIEYLVNGTPMGAAGIHKEGTALLFTEIPDGTDKFRFTAPGYSWFSTSQLYDTNTITLVKEVDPVKYLLIGGALIGGVWWLSRFKK